MFYRSVQLLVRGLWPLFGRLHVHGLHHVPEEGPFFLIANHQSYLDPILIQAMVPRQVYTLAKSTQFSAPITGALLRRLYSIPVRRFEIDPQAVRLVLRHIDAGHGVGVYIEGERSWDARLQPPRLGTLRVILKAGAPVLPCGIRGSYDAWPRWGKLRRGDVHIRIGESIRFPQLEDRADRERAIPETRDVLMGTIAELAGIAHQPAGEGLGDRP